MSLSTSNYRVFAATALALCSAAAAATPVTLNLQGTINGYTFIDLGPYGLSNGTSVSLSLTFNETFSDGTYDFSDPIGPVSGTMTVGSFSYSFDDAQPFTYSYNVPTGNVNWVQHQFLGTGPDLGGGEFYGLFAAFTPALTLQFPLQLGYGFTTAYPDGLTVTSYGYAQITADSYSITPAVGTVPVPATLPLVACALLAAGWVGRRSERGRHAPPRLSLR